VGEFDVRLRLIPHFALGPIADVSDPTPSGGDPLVLRVDDMDRWFDVRGAEFSDIGITSPSYRVGAVRETIFRNGFDAVSGHPGRTSSSFLAYLWPVPGGGRLAHVAKSTSTKRYNGFAATREGAFR